MNKPKRHGDVTIFPVNEIPDDAKPVERDNGRIILAYGEVTGHAHAITADNCELVSSDQAAELYLMVHGTEPVELTHEEHATVTVDPGKYRVRIHREWTDAEEPLRVAD